MKNKGKLITLEGPDFSGKSTQFKQVMANFEDNNILYTGKKYKKADKHIDYLSL